MTANWEKLEGNRGVLTFEVSAEKVNEGLDSAFKKVVQKINVPGFRKGKMPRPMFEKRFGVESLYQDALDFIFPEAYFNAINEIGIDPIDQPENVDFDLDQMGKNKEFTFKATVQVKPEVKLGEYKGLEVGEFDTTVTDEDVQKEIETLQNRHAELVVKEEGAAVIGDTVVIDFEGFVDGEAFEGGKAENYSLELGSGSFIPGFEEQLVGLAAGESKDVEVSFPEEYHAAELAGKPATFKVTVHEIKGKELPALDDEFAKDVDDEVESLDALKQKIRTRLEDSKKHEGEHHVRDTVVEKAAANVEVEVPEVMVNNEVNRMLQEFEQRLQMQGMNLELYFQFSGQDENALREQMKEEAVNRVRVNLTLEAIANAEKLEATDEDVNKELENMATMYNMSVDSIKKALGGVEGIKADLKLKKAVDFLVENKK
ncbi:trigger factor [Neobacillus massiliamazoniensis]|uniref:Trigger factor n=1 Tax=Neobacillus massiliamazoniensis TaxID=1499688 RepID=A0A0U1P221_9BACI|nr:trigger factor [Neobacillus massiliamazoniensis]CRK84329.1 trigger factor [Neobacillus massiliamazoniensis]